MYWRLVGVWRDRSITPLTIAGAWGVFTTRTVAVGLLMKTVLEVSLLPGVAGDGETLRRGRWIRGREQHSIDLRSPGKFI